jgi:hypothetical protein
METQLRENQGEYLVPVAVTVPLYDDSSNPLFTKKTRHSAPESATPFWIHQPSVLWSTWNFLPDSSLMWNEKLNAITRVLFILMFFLFLYTQKIQMLFVGALTILAVVLFHFFHQKRSRETFVQEMDERVRQVTELDDTSAGQLFDKPHTSNPFSNVLVTDYQYNVNKKPAPPLNNPSVRDEVLESAKQTVLRLNPGQPDLANKLFTDLGDELAFEQSMRPFYSTSNTTIPNDQDAFAKFCYGSMISCKEGNAFACARANPRPFP